VDNAVGPIWFRDADGDAHGSSSQSLQACSQPVGYVATTDDCNDADALAFGFPSEVLNLMLIRTPIGAQLDWSGQAATAGPGTHYDIVTGVAADLTVDDGFASSSCLANGLTTNSYTDGRSNPPVPDVEITYYLVRAKNSCGTATFGDGTAIPDRRDVLDATACP
jgi:hypothetical protein